MRTLRCQTTNRSDEILAKGSNFVPTAFAPPLEVVNWQAAMKRAVRDSNELRQLLRLPCRPISTSSPDNPSTQTAGEKAFPVFVPREFLARIEPGNPDDPLLRQVLPVFAEDVEAPGFVQDPVGDLASVAARGLLHKYEGRALIITTGACGIHCRYCFRREFPYSATGSRAASWQPSLDYLRGRSDVEEVLLSGGDPLTLTDEKLGDLVRTVESIGHVRRLRIHTRMPVVIPQRVTDGLVELLSASRLAVWFVIHANHPQELDESVLRGIARLVDAGIPVLNQAVLLRGVNDDTDTLAELCRKLVDHRVQPYYLHQLDRVQGASHFEVPVEEGKRLVASLRDLLPGYAVPVYVVEEPGAASKTPLS